MVNCWFLHRWQLQLVVIIAYGVGVTEIFGIQSEAFHARRKLVEKLTFNSTIDQQILPVLNKTNPVRIGIEITLRQISDVDEVNLAIRLTTWLRLLWNNPFLTWDPVDYDNITSMNIDRELLWTPDIALYNKASLEEDIDILYKRLSTPIILKHNGDCRWLAPATLLSQCRINVADFPFDEQVCKITLGSWTYAQHEIDVYAPVNTTYMNDYIPNGEWDVVEAPLRRNVLTYPGNISYPDVTLYLRIKRQPLYYTLNMIIPCSVIAILAFMSFILPAEHGERVSLAITVLLAMSVYMLIVSSTLPQTSDAIPIIGKYFLCVIVLISLSLFAICLMARFAGQEHEMPKWLDVLVNKWMRRCVLMHRGDTIYQVAKTDWKIKLRNEESEVVEITSDTMEALLAEKNKGNKGKAEHQQNATADQACSALQILADDVTKRQNREAKREKWQEASEVLDRFFLIFFPVLFVILVAFIFG